MRYLLVVTAILMLAGTAKGQNATCRDEQGREFPCTIEHRQDVPFIPQTATSAQILEAQRMANAQSSGGESRYNHDQRVCKVNGGKWHPWKGVYGKCEYKKVKP